MSVGMKPHSFSQSTSRIFPASHTLSKRPKQMQRASVTRRRSMVVDDTSPRSSPPCRICVHRLSGWQSTLRLQVHDELVYEIASDKAESIARRLRDVMEGIVETKLLSGVPIIAEIAIGPNWGAVERIAR